MEVNGQPDIRPLYLRIGGWVGPRTGLYVALHCPESNAGPPARSLVTILTAIPFSFRLQRRNRISRYECRVNTAILCRCCISYRGCWLPLVLSPLEFGVWIWAPEPGGCPDSRVSPDCLLILCLIIGYDCFLPRFWQLLFYNNVLIWFFSIMYRL
jgi:hypothetical protein